MTDNAATAARRDAMRNEMTLCESCHLHLPNACDAVDGEWGEVYCDRCAEAHGVTAEDDAEVG